MTKVVCTRVAFVSRTFPYTPCVWLVSGPQTQMHLSVGGPRLVYDADDACMYGSVRMYNCFWMFAAALACLGSSTALEEIVKLPIV